MKIKLSRSQWEEMGKKAGWMRVAVHPLDKKNGFKLEEIPAEYRLDFLFFAGEKPLYTVEDWKRFLETKIEK